MISENSILSRLPERYERLLERIRRAGGADVEIVAVTKAFGPEVISAAATCGITQIAENYAQECLAKLAAVEHEPLPRLHFIGRLQRNKIKPLADVVDVWQTVDRGVLAHEIGKRSPAAAVMIQVNISGEISKGGCAPDQVGAVAAAVSDAGLELIGLMGIGPLGAPDSARPGFRRLRRMVDARGLRHCSMGMSDDLEVAIAEGSTMVRIGRDLFGERRPESWDSNEPTRKHF